MWLEHPSVQYLVRDIKPPNNQSYFPQFFSVWGVWKENKLFIDLKLRKKTVLDQYAKSLFSFLTGWWCFFTNKIRSSSSWATKTARKGARICKKKTFKLQLYGHNNYSNSFKILHSMEVINLFLLTVENRIWN